MNSLKNALKYNKDIGRRFMVLRFMPPWMDCDGNCIAPPDPKYKIKYTLRGIHWTNEECVEWLKAVAGSKIVWLDDNKFEYAEWPAPMTIGEWAEWEVGKAQWELLGHGSEMTLYFDEVFAARMKSRLHSFEERVSAWLDALATSAKKELDELCARALQRIEQFS
ncbi:hypothetical protein [Pseudomonas amygdali]|uniref:hypothetical protein n=1 Tax=Pseudomonas amygdali TaxID=47877 RepID=UPI000C32F92B|nr:hypothetical protein [Pseudomonas amygdali]PWD02101.1 hypothetical protein CX658_19305 [Pseudomonas amygdali pv. lachrymans]